MADQKFFKLSLEGDVLKVAFGEPAQNDRIVAEVAATIKEMVEAKILPGGAILKINGPASLPVAVTIAHGVLHIYETVSVFDPKLGKYVVSVCHGDAHKPGDLID